MTSSMIVTSSDNGASTTGDEVSTIKSTNSYLSYRQPYMGWRSLERLKLSGGSLLSPEQRLAASLLNQVLSTFIYPSIELCDYVSVKKIHRKRLCLVLTLGST